MPICTTVILARSWPINTGTDVRAVALYIFSKRAGAGVLFRVYRQPSRRQHSASVARQCSLQPGRQRTMTSRGIRRKKSSLAEVKVAVVGAPCVGKSGMSYCEVLPKGYCFLIQFREHFRRFELLLWTRVKFIKTERPAKEKTYVYFFLFYCSFMAPEIQENTSITN